MRVEVALPIPLSRTFTYEVEADTLPEGVRVRVPFGRRKLVGWVVGAAQPKQLGRVRAVDAVLETEPALPADVLRLCHWIAEYYVAPLGIVLRAALPAVLSDTARPDPPIRTRRVIRLTEDLPSLTARDELFGRAQRQRAAFEFLESSGGSADVAHLHDQLGFSDAVLRGLVSRHLAIIEDARVERDPFSALAISTAPRLQPTAAQQDAVARILEAGAETPPRPRLLMGVTGSGKTLVYLEVLDRVVAQEGRGAIVLVPEIALTPQTVARFRARFGDTVAVLHSALSDGERYDAWRSLRDGRRRIAIGARSAIFAPVRDLGVIVLDEEHEATYKQSEAPRYHAREVAIVRSRMAAALCVLGSATPSLESWHNAETGKYQRVALPERIGGRPLPPVRIIDLRAARAPGGGRFILSPPLVESIRERLDRHEQTILLLNRRGFSAFVQCRDCGVVRQCSQCNVSLTYHRARRRLVCHYCFREEPPPVTCDACGSSDLSFRGVGTEQVEREVTLAFPSARVARMDVDTTSGKWSHHDILGRVGAGEVDILLGTQMIAKGLDFPDVTLVGVVDADVAMNLPDFRAAERTFQLLTQVAGRAGRGPRGGAVVVQTALPEHYAIRAAITHDYTTFAEREMEERRVPGYPPYSRLANIVVSGADESAVRDGMRALADWTLDTIRQLAPGQVRLIGPAPCAIDRIRGRWRWHFLLRSARASALGTVLQALKEREGLSGTKGDLRFIIDRDPVTLL
jgi:primosomal protein N' (replication factor Y)